MNRLRLFLDHAVEEKLDTFVFGPQQRSAWSMLEFDGNHSRPARSCRSSPEKAPDERLHDQRARCLFLSDWFIVGEL